MLKTTGKLGAFIDGTVVGVDSDGGTFFPPTGQYVWEASIYSSSSSAQTISFKYWDDVSDNVIDLNETLEFSPDAIYGSDAFAPFQFT